MAIKDKLKGMVVKAPVKPIKPTQAGANAQTDAYGKSMRSAFKATKTFGMPGK